MIEIFCVPGKNSTFMGDASRANVDDKVIYSYDVINNGTATMLNITISDSMVRFSQDSAERVYYVEPLREVTFSN